MILAVVIGNRNILLGGLNDRGISFKARLRTEKRKTSDEYAVDFHMIFTINSVVPADIDGVIIASVVPQVLNTVRTALMKLTGKTCLVVGPGVKTGLNIRLENPAQTGSDLVAGCVAALREYGAPLVVVNMGTATSMVVLDAAGAFIGGCIYPGVQISLEALTEHTALLPGLQLDSPRRVIGRNTADCMRSGMMYGTASLIDGMVERMEAELCCPLKVIASGTVAKFITPLCRREILYDNDLVLKGLGYIYRDNVRPQPEL